MTLEEIRPRAEKMRERAFELEKSLADPGIFSRRNEYKSLSGELARIKKITGIFSEWDKTEKALKENRVMAETESDELLRSLAAAEIPLLEEKCRAFELEILPLLLPADPDDTRDAIVEIRPAAGGEEAALFAAEMYRAYCHYAEKRRWKNELLDMEATELGGIKIVTFSLAGDDVFSRLKYESGVHRVQRVPSTENSGRIHTSTITVSVLPEADELDEIEIRPEDLEISTFRSSGPGGQNVNRTDSAVRMVHKPTGIVTASQQERSQIRNREIALRILRTKLLEMQMKEEFERHAESRRRQIGTGDRSERIRTYNFPQNRVTDHRFNVSGHDLPSLMNGDFDIILDPVFAAERELLIKDMAEGKA